MHKKTALSFVHYGEPEKIEKSFAFNVDIFNFFPRHRVFNSHANHFLIIHNQNPIPHFGNLISTHIPSPSFCRNRKPYCSPYISSILLLMFVIPYPTS